MSVAVSQGLVIVIVEDNAGDIVMVEEALEEAAFPHMLHVVTNGASAVDFLRKLVNNGQPRPDLVILDLNLPGRTGRQIMTDMQAAPDLKDLPVAVFTTSRSENQIGSEFPQLRTTFAAKTADFQELVEIVKRFRDFAVHQP